ncbi:MAG: glycoside hydrolase family 32 protein [Bacteroidales bacterium]|nr:glycoside hydrolase family 32 protein [Bacteroidales bacterium]
MKSKITLSLIVFAVSLFDAAGQADTHSYKSFTPHEVYSNDSATQLEELENSQLLKRFAKSRKQLSKDPHRPLYHFVSPESMLNDPNGLCFYKGKWHMFYQAYPPDEFPKPIKSDIMKRRQHWGHAVSDDLIHWQDLPYAIYPDPEKMCFSGGTVVDGDTVYAFYPGIGAGQMAAKSSDPLLLNWEKITGKPVNTPVGGDACIWKEGDTFFALCGSEMIESKNMADWKAHGDILELPSHIPKDNNACPYFWPIGDKHLFLFFSHSLGGQYYLGDFDNERKKLKVYHHGRFNHGKVSPGGVHAPSAYPDPGNPDEIINIFNINDARPAVYWDQIMSLPQRYKLNPDKTLNIQPLESVESLRKNHRHVGETVLKANEEIELKTINGNSIELALEIDQAEARTIQLNVLQSPDKKEKTSITFYNFDKRVSIWYGTNSELCIDPTHSSLSPDAWVRPPEKATLKLIEDFEMPGEKPLPGENLKLRIFIDKSVVEVFANDKLYMAVRVYPSLNNSTGVSIKATGRDAVLKSLDAWDMKSIY